MVAAIILSLPWGLTLSQSSVSNACGAASVTFWLFAQLPQVIENYRNGSVEGLALPFLANWLFGDVTSLVGAVLTDQLEFQKLLAAYFTVIDIILVIQYFYYSEPTLANTAAFDSAGEPHSATSTVGRRSRYLSASSHHVHARQQRESTMTASFMTDRSAVLPSPAEAQKRLSASRADSRSSAPFQPSKRRRKGDHHGSHDDIESGHDSGSRKRPSRQNTDELARLPFLPQRTPSSGSRLDDSYPSGLPEGMTPSMAEQDLHVPPEMLESFRSERSAASSSSTTIEAMNKRGRDARARWSHSAPLTPLYGPPASGSSSGYTSPTVRRPSTSRDRRDRPSVSRANSASHSRTRSSVVFLSVWAFVGFARLGGFAPGAQAPATSDAVHPHSGIAWLATSDLPATFTTGRGSLGPLEVHVQDRRDLVRIDPAHPEPDPEEPPAPPPPETVMKRSIGRLSAWIAVIFYLTSRMPQIWKNFQRKSVEGLSVLLFVAAFLGNLFYVLSVLSSPLVQEEEGYLFESVPFLLGSGGTLGFDCIVICQFLLYRKTAHAKHVHHTSHKLDTEESAGLLAEEEEGDERRNALRSGSRQPNERTRSPHRHHRYSHRSQHVDSHPSMSQSWPSVLPASRSRSRKRDRGDRIVPEDSLDDRMYHCLLSS